MVTYSTGTAMEIIGIYRDRFPYPKLLGNYTQEELLRFAKLSKRWCYFLCILVLPLLICFVILLNFILYYLYLGLCYLLQGEGTWYFQHFILFCCPAMLLAFPIVCLALYEIVRIAQPKDYDKLVDFLNLMSGYDSTAAMRWTLRGFIKVTLLYVPLCGFCFIAVKKDGILIKQVFGLTFQHYNYSDVARVIHYKPKFDSTKKEFSEDHYDIILKNGKHISDLAPLSYDPSAYHKKIIEVGKLKVEEADKDQP